MIGIPFNKRTITVTALTGAAVVNIRGETNHSACALNRKLTNKDVDEWKDTLMVIIDEVSFASETTLKQINSKLNALKEIDIDTYPGAKFGNIPILFAGDFTQLEPVMGKPVWLNENNIIWYEYVNTFIELKTNHRFNKDNLWGSLLQRMRIVFKRSLGAAKWVNDRAIF